MDNPAPVSPIAPVEPIMNPAPVQSVLQSPIAPTSPPEQSSINKKIYVIVAIVLVILLLFGGSFLFLSKSSKKGTGIAPSILQNLETDDLTKYNKDTDSDGYPDFIEIEVGLDPNVSEYTSCKSGGCADSQMTNSPSVKHNVLIILDASGSMALGGTPNQMEIAKTAIKSYVAKASADTQIGFMVYGHKGSNSEADKAVSCASAEVLSSIGSINSSSIEGVLAGIKPTGWTPMGKALHEAAVAFVGKEGENNEIILLSDGEETCNSNPTGEATTLKNSAQKITINVIGFAVNSSAQTQLNQISSSGGGTFSSANSLSELDRKFNELYENGLRRRADIKCNLADVEAFRACYNTSFGKVRDWIQNRKLLLYDKKISQEEYNKLDDLSSKAYAQRKEITTSETQKVIDKY